MANYYFFARKRRIGSCEGMWKTIHGVVLGIESLPMTTYLNNTWPNCLEISQNFDIQPQKNLDLFPKIGPGPIMRTLVTNGPRDGWMVQALSKSWHRQKPWYQTQHIVDWVETLKKEKNPWVNCAVGNVSLSKPFYHHTHDQTLFRYVKNITALLFPSSSFPRPGQPPSERLHKHNTFLNFIEIILQLTHMFTNIIHPISSFLFSSPKHTYPLCALQNV